jgi:hypothetical protein
MATTTPNYGWTVPTSTDLVKDGATAIELLGDSIDASLAGLKNATQSSVDALVVNPAGTVYAASAGTDPAVTVTTGTRALVIISARFNGTNFNFCSYNVSGATTIAASDDRAATNQTTSQATITQVILQTGLTAGSNTFTMRYRCNVSASGSYEYRKLTVIPLP